MYKQVEVLTAVLQMTSLNTERCLLFIS